jgi:hypothetical protein
VARGRPVSQVETETDLLEWVDHLEALTTGGVSPKFPEDDPFEGYDDLCEAAATAEADWKIAEANELVALADRPREEGTRGDPEYVRKARVLAIHRDKFRAYKMADAKVEARKKALAAVTTRCDSLRTVCANTRTQV